MKISTKYPPWGLLIAGGSRSRRISGWEKLTPKSDDHLLHSLEYHEGFMCEIFCSGVLSSLASLSERKLGHEYKCSWWVWTPASDRTRHYLVQYGCATACVQEIVGQGHCSHRCHPIYIILCTDVTHSYSQWYGRASEQFQRKMMQLTKDAYTTYMTSFQPPKCCSPILKLKSLLLVS